MKAAEILAKTGEEAANAYLADARAKVLPMLDALSKELAELKDIEPVLDLWRQSSGPGEDRRNNAAGSEIRERGSGLEEAREPAGQGVPAVPGASCRSGLDGDFPRHGSP